MNYKEEISLIYSEIIEEAKRGHGDEKAVLNALKEAESSGLVRIEEVKNGFMIKSNVDNSQHLAHKGDKGFHHLRRYLIKLSKFGS